MMQHPPKKKANDSGESKALENVQLDTEQCNFTSKRSKPKAMHETATAAQYARILDLLQPCGKPVHTLAMRSHGIMSPAIRTKELREKYGYPIECVGRVTVYDEGGYPHKNVAEYAMICPSVELGGNA